MTPADVAVLNPAPEVAACFQAWCERHPGFTPVGAGTLRVLSSGDAARFAAHGARFLGETLPAVEHIAEQNGRLALCPEGSEPVGQVVR